MINLVHVDSTSWIEHEQAFSLLTQTLNWSCTKRIEYASKVHRVKNLQLDDHRSDYRIFAKMLCKQSNQHNVLDITFLGWPERNAKRMPYMMSFKMVSWPTETKWKHMRLQKDECQSPNNTLPHFL